MTLKTTIPALRPADEAAALVVASAATEASWVTWRRPAKAARFTILKA